MDAPAIPRPSATLVVVCAAPEGLELLLMQRADKGDHNSGAWVFPGGLVEPADRRCHPHCSGLDDAAASALLGVAGGGLDFYIAAIRECFEEAGLLFAVDQSNRVISLEGDAGARFTALRQPLHRGERELADVCREFGLRLAADWLFYIGHWVTPLGLPKRFDTRFFLAVLPEGQASKHDAVETLDQVWLRPAAALSPENSRRLLKVTRSVIELIGRFADTDALLAWARSPREVPMVMQRRSRDGSGPRTLMPHEPAYAEVGRLDPQGKGTVCCELQPGVAVRLSPRVLRVTAPGQSGANAYLVGGAHSGWAAIDPGHADQSHVEALIAAAAGPIRWILLTHDGDLAAANLLAARTGAQLLGAGADNGGTLALGGGITLRGLCTTDGKPRACYLLVEEKTLFTGALQLDAALPELAGVVVEWIAPAHGFLLPAPRIFDNRPAIPQTTRPA